jgi:uncharacterized membrane protein YfcA
MNPTQIILLFTGLFAGFVDSIAGGGGLITLPALSIAVGPGAPAIGTNKIVGVTAALVALLVYGRKVKIPWDKGLCYSLWIMVGSIGGSMVTPHLPTQAFKWFLVITFPVILWTIWRKDIWLREASAYDPKAAGHKALAHYVNMLFYPPLLLAGLACGFYDGMWGPGGGTFMLLGLLLVVRLPLLPAIAASKLANTVSAGASLVSYSMQGLVTVNTGIWVALGTVFGAALGAQLASQKAAVIVRPVLFLVASLLMIKNILHF